MAAILRYGQSLRRLSSTRTYFSAVHSHVKQIIRRQEVHSFGPAYLNCRCFATQNVQQNVKADNRGMGLDKALQRIDMTVRRIGRINLKEVEGICNEIKTSGRATSTHSLLVIRCCGALLPDELPEVRTALVNDVWSMLETLAVPLDVSHHNALLKVYLENEHKFSPTDFLAQMEKKGVVPNRVTYQRLITHYCQFGDIEGAGKILEYMKEKDLPINENVFNALILGHSRANDMESAKGILEAMRTAKLEPSTDTYTALLCGYAEKGDIEAIKTVFLEAENKEILLFDQDYLEIIYALAKSGHANHVDEVISRLRKVTGFVQDAIITILRLVNCNQDDVAYKLLKVLPMPNVSDGISMPSGNLLIRQMVRLERPIEKILSVCESMKQEGINSVALLRATEMALIHGKTELALGFIKTMQEQDLPIRVHYFWPIFATLVRQKQEENVYELAELMLKMDCGANFATFLDYVFPGISLQDPDAVILKFKNYGYTIASVVSPMVEYFVTQNNIKAAVELLETHPVRCNSSSLSKPLAYAHKVTGDVDSTVSLLQKMRESSSRDMDRTSRTDWVGQCLLDSGRILSGDVGSMKALLQGLSDKGLGLSQATIEIIQNMLRDKITPDVEALLVSLKSSDVDLPADFIRTGLPHPREMTVEDLESHLVELKEKNMNPKGVLRQLLMEHARNKNLDRMEEIKTELDSMQFVYTSAAHAQMMGAYVHHNKLDLATTYFNLLKQQPDFLLDDHKLLNYATLLVKEGKIDEAVKHLTEIPINHSSTRSTEPNAWRLLNAVAETGDVESTEKLMDVMLSRKLCEISNVILGPIIKAHLIKDDLTGAIAKFEEYSKTHRCTPWKNQLFFKLIETEDSARLQKVMDLNTEIHGEINTLYDLAYSFLEANRFKEAQKILETPGLRAKHARLDNMCQRLVNENKIDKLEQLVSITKELFDVDRDRMYFYLLKAYGRANDHENALNVWTAMQEEDVQPSPQTMIYLANLLKENNQPIPFTVPELPSTNPNISRPSPAATVKVTSMEAMIKQGRLDEAIDLKRRRDAVGGALSVEEASALIEALVQTERLTEAKNVCLELLDRGFHPRPNVFRFLIVNLARGGDVDSLKDIEPKLTDETKKTTKFNSMLFTARINSGNHLEVLEALEKDVEGTVDSCPTAGLLALLRKHKDLESRVENLATEYAKFNYCIPLNMVWIHYFTQEQYEKADSLLKMTPRFQEMLLFRSVLDHARQTDNVSMLHRLQEVIKSTNLPLGPRAAAFAATIELQCKLNKYDDALQTVELAQAEGVHTLMRSATWTTLKRGLESQGKAIPSNLIPTSTENVRRSQLSTSSSSSSSSSSSESDSDSETEKKAKKATPV